MEPILLNSGTMGAGRADQEQSLAPRKNTTETQRATPNASADASRDPTEGASFSGPGNPQQPRTPRTVFGSANSS
jgi:hypothetical protein